MNPNVEIFPHNKRVYEKVCLAFETSNRTCVVQPTGTGKMYIAMQLIDDHPAKEILYLTSYSPILSALDKEMQKCGISSAHLSKVLYAGLDDNCCAKKYDYIIMDEFHRAGAEVWGSRVSTLLENNPEAKVLGLSATPIRYLDNNRDMSDELFDGNVASSMTLAEAVGTGILKMPKYVCTVYSLAEEWERYKERIGKMKASTNKTEALALLEKARRSLEQADGLPEIFAQQMPVKDGRYIVFCRNYEHLESMKVECQEWFKDVNSEIAMYELRTIHSDSVNEKTLSDFNSDWSNKLKLLFVVDMLNEGVHLKNVDGCIMLRPTESMNVFLQQLGRAISVGNTGHTIIFDIVNNSAQLIAFGGFKSDAERAAAETGSGIQLADFEIHEKIRDFWDIVSQIDIQLSNKSWDEWFALAQDFYRQFGHLSITRFYQTSDMVNLGQWIGTQRRNFNNGVLPEERKKKLESIGMVWNPLTAEWNRMFLIASNYFNDHRNLNVPLRFVTYSGDNLGQWVACQRKAYKKGTLTIDQEEKLSSIGMLWDTLDEEWNRMFDLAKEYFDEHGEFNISQRYVDLSGNNLGGWSATQRKAYSKGILSDERIRKLESIGMVWNSFDKKWTHMYVLAKDYFEKQGHLRVPQGFITNNGEQLGVWLSRQRKKGNRGQLSQLQVQKLSAIGMSWNPANEEWNRMFVLAKEYFDKHGNLNISTLFVCPSGDKLGAWISWQRSAYNKGSLSVERKAKLDTIGMVWDPLSEEWKRMYAFASAYYQDNGDLMVPRSFITASGDKLGIWVRTQKESHKEGKLSMERQKQLEAIGMVWDDRIPNRN